MTVRTIDEELVLREQKTGSELVGALIPVLLAGVLCTTPVAELTSSVGEALVEDAIVNGVTTKAPSQNAVYDALVLKADASALSSYLTTAAAAGTYLSIASAIAGYQPLDADLTSWSAVIRAAGFDAFVASPSSSNLRSLVSDETGSGALVFATSPVLVTPNLGTPSAGVLTNCTGLPNTSVIGLGTAALATIGTSGDTVPKNNTANTWSAVQTFSYGGTTVFNRPSSSDFLLELKDNGTTRGYIGCSSTNAFVGYNSGLTKSFSWNSSTGQFAADSFLSGGVAVPTISSIDTLSNKTLASPTLSGTVAGPATFSGAFTNTAGPTTIPAVGGRGNTFLIANSGSSAYGVLIGSESATGAGWIQAQKVNGDTDAYALKLQPNGGGVLIGSPTGGDKGSGTLNATAVYDDNTLLTCYIVEAWKYGQIDLDKWDAIAPNREHPAQYEQVETGERDAADKPILEQRLVKEAWTETRQHLPARGFAKVAADRLDIDKFAEFVWENERLPAFPAPDRWADMYAGKMATGDLIQRLWETSEVMAVHSIEARKRELALIARVDALQREIDELKLAA